MPGCDDSRGAVKAEIQGIVAEGRGLTRDLSKAGTLTFTRWNYMAGGLRQLAVLRHVA